MVRIVAFVLALWVPTVALAENVPAVPPEQIGRLASIAGSVSYYSDAQAPAAEAAVNYPLTAGNRIATPARGHAAVDIAAGRFHLDGGSTMTIGALGPGTTSVTLEQGAVILHILPGGEGQVFVIQTPRGALRADQPGYFEVEVAPETGAVVVSTLEGGAQFDATVLPPGTRAAIAKDSMPVLDAAREDDFIRRIAAEVVATGENILKAPSHVSPQATGFQELQRSGLWIATEQYGWVWEPQVASDWAPLRDGRWVEIARLGKTWIDDAPWGFAPSHYGRWTEVNGRWVWIPGNAGMTSVNGPAAGLFGTQDRNGQGAVGWVPLGPEEPSFASSPVIVNTVRVISTPAVPKVVTVTNVNNTTNVTNVVKPDRQPAVVLIVPSFPSPPPTPTPGPVGSPSNLTGLGASGAPVQSGVSFPGTK